MKYLICKDEKQEKDIMSILNEFETDSNGLSTSEVLARQEIFGLNEFPVISFSCDFTSTVLRDGDWAELPSVELVPGDIIKIAQHDVVPADAIIIIGEGLHTDEAIFTDEFTPGHKQLLEKVFAGTVVLRGIAVAVVGETGHNTLLSNVITSYNALNNQLFLS